MRVRAAGRTLFYWRWCWEASRCPAQIGREVAMPASGEALASRTALTGCRRMTGIPSSSS
jgi:hypothetical protein